MKLIENYAARMEQFLNPFDWVPYISTISGVVRVLAGAVQIAAALVFAYFKIIDNLITFGRVRFVQVMEQSGTYALHGVANIARGALAIHPWWNLFLAVHDWKLGRFNYPQEDMSPKVYPLSTGYLLARY